MSLLEYSGKLNKDFSNPVPEILAVSDLPFNIIEEGDLLFPQIRRGPDLHHALDNAAATSSRLARTFHNNRDLETSEKGIAGRRELKRLWLRRQIEIETKNPEEADLIRRKLLDPHFKITPYEIDTVRSRMH